MLTKIKITETTVKLFAEKGTEFSISEITKAVGIKKASFYAHFASKEELLYKIIDTEIDAYFFEVKEDHRELKEVFFAILDYYHGSVEKLYFWKRLRLFPPLKFKDTLIKKIEELSQRRHEIIKEIIAEYIEKKIIPDQDVETTALTFLSLIHGMLSSVIIYDSRNISQYYEGIWKIFWRGIGGTE